jgi:hypothetical protein
MATIGYSSVSITAEKRVIGILTLLSNDKIENYPALIWTVITLVGKLSVDRRLK